MGGRGGDNGRVEGLEGEERTSEEREREDERTRGRENERTR